MPSSVYSYFGDANGRDVEKILEQKYAGDGPSGDPIYEEIVRYTDGTTGWRRYTIVTGGAHENEWSAPTPPRYAALRDWKPEEPAKPTFRAFDVAGSTMFEVERSRLRDGESYRAPDAIYPPAGSVLEIEAVALGDDGRPMLIEFLVAGFLTRPVERVPNRIDVDATAETPRQTAQLLTLTQEDVGYVGYVIYSHRQEPKPARLRIMVSYGTPTEEEAAKG